MRSTHLVLLLSIAAACHEGSVAVVPIFLEIVVESDPAMRLGAVPIRIDGEPVGQTSSQGTLRVPISRAPGRVLRVTHECPLGHHAPSRAVSIRIRHYELERPAPLSVKLQCRPVTRVAAFVVRAKGGPGLPIFVNGEHIATTNDAGVAHFSRSGPPGTEYLVEVDANSRPSLLPRSTATLVRLPDANEIFVIAPSFQSSDRTKRAGRRRPRIIKIE
jgi:hypothetical protein